MVTDSSNITTMNGEAAHLGHPWASHTPPQIGETAIGAAPAPAALDQEIQSALDDIPEGCSPTALEGHARTLAQILIDAKANSLVSDAAFGRLKKRLGDLKLSAVEKSVWTPLLKEVAAAAAVNCPATSLPDDPPALLVMVRAVLPFAPVPEHSVVPQGWQLRRTGVYRSDADTAVEVLPTPLLIASRLVDDAQQTESVRLLWFRDGRWQERICPRSTIAVTRVITELSDHGVPVNSLNAAEVVAYLSAYEVANLAVLPRTRVRSQLGWIVRTLSGFLWGRTLLTGARRGPHGQSPSSAAIAPPPGEPLGDTSGGIPPEDSGVVGQGAAAVDPEEVYFQGADSGDEQVAAAYHARGDFGQWKRVIAPALGYPVPRLAQLASLGAPLPALLADEGARNFAGDLRGETSKGKTTILRLAASAWGSPREDSEASALTSWSTTLVAAERRAGLLNGLPLLRADTKLARPPEAVSQVIYEVSEGRTRDRGTIKGLGRNTAFSTILLLSGEARAVSLSGDAGTRARILTLWGMPFGKADAETASLVAQINEGCICHYGHAGPAFVEFLLANRARWPQWRARYASIKQQYAQKASGDSVVNRLADAFALIDLAGELATEALALPELASSPIGPLWEILTAEASEADRASEALRHVWGWAAAHQEELYACPIGAGRGDSEATQPLPGWAGQWNRHDERWRFLGVIPARLREILQEVGYDYDAVVSTWKDRGWLLVDGSDATGRHHQVRVGAAKTRMVAVTRGAIEAVGCDTRDDARRVREIRDTAGYSLAELHHAPEIFDAAARTSATQGLQALVATLRATEQSQR
jgi:hypothetical protein